jgi:hypothetical protein
LANADDDDNEQLIEAERLVDEMITVVLLSS